MIMQLKSMLKSNAYRFFLWIFLAVLLFGGMSFDFGNKQPFAVKIYKHKITDSDFRQSVQETTRKYDYFKSQGFNWPRTETIEREVLRNVVTRGLIRNISDILCLTVPGIILQEQIHAQLAGLPSYFFDGQGQLIISMLEKVIAPKTFQSLIDDMEQDVKSHLIYELINMSSYVPSFQLKMQYNQELATKKYSLISLSLEQALDKVKKEKVSPETLEQFYKKSEHADRYKTVELRSGTAWTFSSKGYGLTVSKADVTNYYDKHKVTEFLQSPAQVQLHRIFFAPNPTDEKFDARAQAQIVADELAKDPGSFATVAKKIAALKVSYQGAEKTEFFAKDTHEYDPLLVTTGFEELQQDGDISSIIKTDKGYEILQRVARKSAIYTPLAQVYATIEAQLIEQKFAQRFKQDAQRLISNSAYNPASLESFIEKRHAIAQDLPMQSKKTGLVHMHLFQTEVGMYSIFMQGNDGILLYCKDIEKKKLKPFESIAEQVKADYYQQQAEKELQAMTKACMKQALQTDIKSASKAFQAEFIQVQAEFRNNKMEIPAILQDPLVQKKIKSLESVGNIIDIVTPQFSYIIRLDELLPVDELVTDEHKKRIKGQLEQQVKSSSQDSFIALLYRHATLDNEINIQEQLLKI